MDLTKIGRYDNSLHLTHNQHKASYQSVAEYLDEEIQRGYIKEDTISPELRKQMEEQNSIWELQVYPNTANGSYVFYDVTYEGVCRQAKETLAQLFGVKTIPTGAQDTDKNLIDLQLITKEDTPIAHPPGDYRIKIGYGTALLNMTTPFTVTKSTPHFFFRRNGGNAFLIINTVDDLLYLRIWK